jgi:hypothetical protein
MALDVGPIGTVPSPDADPDADPDANAEEAPPTVGQLLVSALDGTIARVARRPVRVRVGASPRTLVKAQVDVLLVEVRALNAARLPVERLLIRAEKLKIAAALPPRLQATSIGFKATISQKGIDQWTRSSRLPVRLELTEDAVVAHAGIRGITMSEIAVQLVPTNGSMLKLIPRRASMFGMRAPVIASLPGYLPLPALPAGARITKVEPGGGTLTIYLDAGEIDEPINPALAARLVRRFSLPSFGRR